MKQLYTFLLSLFFLVGSVGQVYGQNCPTDFTVKATTTPSTCQANGTVTISLEGASTDLYNEQYSLTSSGGFNVQPQVNPVMTNIPAGTYSVSVRAFCRSDPSYDIVKTINNVVVGGNYKVPSVSFNAIQSRKSYAGVGTGIIALNVSEGSGNYAFTIESAPAGVTTGAVSSTHNGPLYTLAGENYPAGDYVVSVNDGCYNAKCQFTLGEISGLPYFTITFSSSLIDRNCSQVYMTLKRADYVDADYYRYFLDDMYEMGIGDATNLPSEWVPCLQNPASPNTSKYLLNIPSPYSYSDFYAYYPSKILVYVRLKGHNDIKESTAATAYYPSIRENFKNGCGDSYTYTMNFEGNDLFCFPLTIEIKRNGDNQVMYSKKWSYNSSGLSLPLQYDQGYTLTVVGANDEKYVDNKTINQSRSPIMKNNSALGCDSYKIRYFIYADIGCWPVRVDVLNSSGTVVFTDYLYGGNPSGESAPVNYDEDYTVIGTYVNSNPVYTSSFTIKEASSLPTVYGIAVEPNECKEGYGRLTITSSDDTKYYPAGTRFTITGPPGYTSQQATTGSSYNFFKMDDTFLPAGTYTLTVTHPCGSPVYASYTYSGAYDGSALSYTTENTCNGLKVTPSGSVTNGGAAVPTSYRLISGPKDYDPTVKKPGESYLFTIPGTYVLGIMKDGASDNCVLRSDTIVYEKVPLALSRYETTAYECAGTTQGVILLKAINGVAPYTYELWNESNTAKVGVPDITTSDRADFMYGSGGIVYTVRVRDYCGNNFNQQVTIAKLSSMHVVYADKNQVCNGDSIMLKCMTLGHTTYKWTGPNGFTSTEQNPKLANAGAAMTGLYKVSVVPEYCSVPMEDGIYIKVFDPLVADTISLNQRICVRSVAQPMYFSIKGGSGNPVYQWQTSTDEGTSWEDITGETRSTYTPQTMISSQGTKGFYRAKVSNTCGTIFSNPITIEYKPCYIPVNKNVQSRAAGR